jgi:hypothetical protein
MLSAFRICGSKRKEKGKKIEEKKYRNVVDRSGGHEYNPHPAAGTQRGNSGSQAE